MTYEAHLYPRRLHRLSEKSISLALLKAVAPIVTRLEITGAMDDEKMRGLGDVLLACRTGRLGSLRCSVFEVQKGATKCDLSSKKLGPAAATLLAGVVKFNAELKELKYAALISHSPSHFCRDAVPCLLPVSALSLSRARPRV